MKHLEAIKALLKLQHAGTPDAIINRVAAVIAKTVKDEATEEDIKTAVAGQADMVTSLAEYAQQEGDRRVTEALKKAEQKKQETPPTPATPTPPAEAKPKEEEIPAWAKPLIEGYVELKSRDAAKTHGELLSSLLKDKVPSSFYGIALQGRQFGNEDEVKTFAQSIEAGYAAFKQEQANAALGGQTPPAVGHGDSGSGGKEAELDAAEKAYLELKNPKKS